jgi:tetratricopeptide (TPR) repeat protein
MGVGLGLLALALSAVPMEAQQFRWPERAENLQSLPEDFPASRLRAVMTGFTRALGVRCSHCHVGPPGASLAEMDFPSDDNPNKRTARVMLDMLGSVNDYLDQIEPTGPERVNMWCTTCHNGKPRPMTLAEALTEAYNEGGSDAALERFDALRDRYFARGAYDFSADGVGRIAIAAAENDRAEFGTALAERNLGHWPDAAASHVGMAQVLLAQGDTEGAIRHLEHALERDPDNRQIQRQLNELRGSGPDR